MEKLEYNRYYTNINKEWVQNSTGSGDLFSYTNGSHEFSIEFCVVSFQVLGKDLMEYARRSGKSPSLGIPKAPHGNIQGQPSI